MAVVKKILMLKLLDILVVFLESFLIFDALKNSSRELVPGLSSFCLKKDNVFHNIYNL